MPIVEKDPWREQYFDRVTCPDDLLIPTDDELAYKLYPQHRWVYNKLLICDTQGLEAAPNGIEPPRYPVFSKPIYNLRGMGVGGRVIHNREEWDLFPEPGYMWMPFCEGEHLSSDAALVDGEPVWWRHTLGKPLEGGMFDHWTVLAESRPGVEKRCGDWLRQHLKGYTGCINIETIGESVIECHLRFADQWPDLYGEGWLDAVVELYRSGRWSYADRDRRDGYSVVLFGAHGLRYRIDPAAVEPLRQTPGVSSIQVTFHQDFPPESHAMPPGGFRLAVVNCWDLEVGCQLRKELALLFWTTQTLTPGGVHV